MMDNSFITFAYDFGNELSAQKDLPPAEKKIDLDKMKKLMTFKLIDDKVPEETYKIQILDRKEKLFNVEH